MYPVYVLISMINPNKTYVGITNNIFRRWCEHNKGRSKYTSKYRPWKLACFIYFENRNQAEKFEQYLKRGSGFAFMKKHLLPKEQGSYEAPTKPEGRSEGA